jgi:hypothetical protein
MRNARELLEVMIEKKGIRYHGGRECPQFK